MAKSSSNGKRGQVKYHLDKVDQIPDSDFQRGMRYFNLLKPLVEDPGSVYCVATFSTDSGASVVKKALDSGERRLPTGKWNFEARTSFDEDGRKISKLYAMYAGPQ